MANVAPFADIPIPLSLRSTTALRYRLLNCMECGQGFMERNGDTIYRLNTQDLPAEVRISADGSIKGLCGNCQQQYAVTLVQAMGNPYSNMPLNMQPQSIFLSIVPVKKLRDIYCLECGKAYYSISDRIRMMVDNVAPIESVQPDRLGPMEARCKFHHCKQRWHVRV